jgi:hypothetical protein
MLSGVESAGFLDAVDEPQREKPGLESRPFNPTFRQEVISYAPSNTDCTAFWYSPDRIPLCTAALDLMGGSDKHSLPSHVFILTQPEVSASADLPIPSER